jgi:hypothetical protein
MRRTFEKLLGFLAHMALQPARNVKRRQEEESASAHYLILNRGISDLGNDHLEHVNIILAREQRFSPKELRQNAPDSPHIDALVVVLLAKQEFGGAIPEHEDIQPHKL